jgi:thymidine kinase
MEGYLYLIIGPMFAGKSSKLIRLIRNFRSKNIPILVLKHSLDTRYDSLSEICSHDQIKEPCKSTDNLVSYLNTNDYNIADIIVIEEAQFFGNDLITFCKQATDIDNKYVIVTGLSGNYKRKPFGKILELVPLADKIDKLEAYCFFCEKITPANYTLRLSKEQDEIIVGENNLYQAACRKHFNEFNKSD